MLAASLVGRIDEVGSPVDALDEPDGDHSGATEMAGEPGIGKTRLLHELAARAEQRGHLVLSRWATELEWDLSFWVLVDPLHEYLEELDAGSRA